MFMRKGDARGARAPDTTLTQLQEARAAAANAEAYVPLTNPAQLATTAPPPPIPPAPSLAAGHSAETSSMSQDNLSVIGEDLTIEGQAITIRCRGALEIKGRIQAELHSQKLIVGQTGQVEGTITADSIDIWGRVAGTIMGSRVTLHASADVEGDIHARTLSVADGASFEGRSRKVADAASISPRLEAGAPAPANDTPAPRSIPLTAQMATASG